MIVIPDQVKQPMHHDTVQFLLEGSAVLRRVFANGIDADKQVSAEHLSLTIIEGNDVGKIIVLQVALVDIQDIRVRTKDNADVSEPLDLALGNQLQPLVIQGFTLELEPDIFAMITDHFKIFCKSTTLFLTLGPKPDIKIREYGN